MEFLSGTLSINSCAEKIGTALRKATDSVSDLSGRPFHLSGIHALNVPR